MFLNSNVSGFPKNASTFIARNWKHTYPRIVTFSSALITKKLEPYFLPYIIICSIFSQLLFSIFRKILFSLAAIFSFFCDFHLQKHFHTFHKDIDICFYLFFLIISRRYFYIFKEKKFDKNILLVFINSEILTLKSRKIM